MRAAERLLLLACTAAIFVVIAGVFASPVFARWEEKEVAAFYSENSLRTGSSSVVSAIVWDFRGFDTMGEETVLFAAAAGVLAITAIGFAGRKE